MRSGRSLRQWLRSLIADHQRSMRPTRSSSLSSHRCSQQRVVHARGFFRWSAGAPTPWPGSAVRVGACRRARSSAVRVGACRRARSSAARVGACRRVRASAVRVGAKTRLDRSITLIIAEPKLTTTTTNQPSFTTHNNNNNYNTRVQGGCSKLQAKSPVTEGLFVHLGELISRAGPACAPVRSARGGPRPRLFCGSRP